MNYTGHGAIGHCRWFGTAVRTIRHFKLKHWAMQMVCNWALQLGPLGTADGSFGHCRWLGTAGGTIGRCSGDSWVLHIGALGTAVSTTKEHWVLQLGQ